MRFTRTALAFLMLGALLTGAVSAQVTAPAGPVIVSAAVNIPAGDDGWFTTNDLNTYIDFVGNPIPAGFFGPLSNAFSGKITLKGENLINSGGLGPNTDTIVRRLADTGLIAVGGCRTIPIDFQALRLKSNPFTVTNSDGTTETWQVVAGLSTAAAQPIGTMTICRTCADGGTFTANLYAYFLNRYQRLSPAPFVEIPMDCGLGMCPQVLFQSGTSDWTLAGGPWGFNQAAYGVDALPAGVQLDVDADGTLDSVWTVGNTNFQGGVKLCGVPGYTPGGGGAPECATAEHVANNGGGDHNKSSHKNYVAATGDSNPADGIPDHCVCPDENKDGYNDNTGEPCNPDGEPHDTDSDADTGGDHGHTDAG